MINIPVRVKERLVAGLKRYQPILQKARDKDINESDTVTIIADVLSDVYGYDKYTEITSEVAIKRTYCDLAVKISGEIKLLIEVKAAGMTLKDQHTKQAVDYGSNDGIDWVILTNGCEWKVYNIVFAKPVTAELVYEFDMTQLSTKKQGDLELLFYLTKEAMLKSSKASLDDYHAQKQLVNRFVLGQLLLTDPVVDALRRQIRKMSPEAKSANEELVQILLDEVIKRDVLDGERADEAKKRVLKAMKSPTKPAVKAAPPKASEKPVVEDVDA